METRGIGGGVARAQGEHGPRLLGARGVSLGPLVILVGVVVVAGLLSGCIGPTAEDDARLALAGEEGESRTEAVLADPEGDATEWNTDFAQAQMTRCGFLGPGQDACNEAVGPVRDEVAGDDAGVPAHPALDLLEVRLTESPTELIVEMEVASLAEGFEGVIPDDHREKAAWATLWTVTDDPGEDEGVWEGVLLVVSRPGGVLTVEPWYMSSDPACNEGSFCWLPVDVEVVPGTPGVIEIAVPRAFLAQGEEGTLLTGINADSRRAFWPVDRTLGWQVGDPALGLSGSTFLPRWYDVDAAGTGEFTFETEQEPVDLSTYSRSAVEHPAGDQRAEVPRPDLDIRGIEIQETPSDVTVVTEISLVEQDSARLGGWVLLATNKGPVVTVGYDRHEGELEPWAQGCKGTNCSEWGALEVDAEIIVTPGSPGDVAISFPREALGSPMEGDLLTWAWTEIWGIDGVNEQVDVLGSIAVERGLSGDWIMPFPLYVFERDTQQVHMAEETPTSTYLLEDPEEDLASPDSPPVVGDTSRFDVASLEARMTDSHEMVFTIGVNSPLTSTEPPPGYKSTVYAVGIETVDGAFMANYIDDGETRPGFFCSPDTVVLTEDRQDPSLVSGQSIEGLVSPSPRDNNGEYTGSGSITFFVPSSCLMREDSDTIAAPQVGAGSYLVPHTEQAGQPVAAMDDVTADGPVLFGPDPLAVASVPWYDDPFGVTSFWDILGLVVAITITVGSIVVVRRRRSLLRRYLAEIEAAEAGNPGAPASQEAELVALRRRLKKDLMKGRIPESHYVIVEGHMEASLSESRVSGLLDLFGDLPHRLLTNLESMLSDGVLSERDYATLCALLDESPLQQEAKHAIQDRLAQWLEQDEGSAVPIHRLARP